MLLGNVLKLAGDYTEDQERRTVYMRPTQPCIYIRSVFGIPTCTHQLIRQNYTSCLSERYCSSNPPSPAFQFPPRQLKTPPHPPPTSSIHHCFITSLSPPPSRLISAAHALHPIGPLRTRSDRSIARNFHATPYGDGRPAKRNRRPMPTDQSGIG
jgi:hypothetical protein